MDLQQRVGRISREIGWGLWACWLLGSAGCFGSSEEVDQPDWATETQDEEAEDADLDGDGWTVAEGDCDDREDGVYPGALEVCDGDDNDCDGVLLDEEDVDEDGDGFPLCDDCDDQDLYVNKAWDEDPSDGKDNDCDGRVDEEWSGLTVAHLNEDGASSMLTTDSVGRLVDEVSLDEGYAPMWMDHALGGGWVFNNYYYSISLSDEQGGCEDLVVFKDVAAATMGLFGVATHPDGYYVASTLGSLIRIDPDGSVTELASWEWDWYQPDTFELAVYTVAVGPGSSEVGLVGYFGGFGTWSPEDGLVVRRVANLKDHDGMFTYSGAAKDGGGWFTAAYDGAEDTYGIYRFIEETGEWETRATWYEDLWTPNILTIDGDNGDYYVSANAAWYRTLWRIRDEDNYASDFYNTGTDDGSEGARSFQGVVSNY